MSPIYPVMQLIINAYRKEDINALNDILSDPQNIRVVHLWIENHPGQISRSPMLNDLKNRVYHLNAPIVASDVESKILAGHELTPEDVAKNLELIKTHLELKTLDFSLLLDKLSTEDLTAILSSLDALPDFAKLTKSQILRLSTLSNGLEEEDAALALYIEQHKISLRNLKLNSAEFLRLAPHLRYVDIKDFPDIPLAKDLLQKCSNLNVLLINDGDILEKVSSLPLCKVLRCTECKNLTALPELPLCRELYCRDCELPSLPALPLCETLFCYGCINLQALPALPLCKELTCCGCTKLRALPALPLCEMLSCYNCTYLTALPALPLCKELDCGGCRNLPALPALPLCEKLYCGNCYNLRGLPALPLCKELFCYHCSNLTSLPEMPLCESLQCENSTNLATLPLSLGHNAGLTSIVITGTRIEPAVRDAILNQCRQMRDAEAVIILPSRLAKWQAIAKSDADLDVNALSETQKKTLNEWLLRLERTKDFRESQSLLAQTVCKILADLLKNAEFQELFFSQAEANNACCEDRAAMSLNEIYTSWMVMCKSGDLHLLTGIAKTLRLRKELQKLIGDQEESVEIFLYYESTLRERLGLETAIQNMTYGRIGKRDWINEDKLVEDVDAHFFEELFELPVFEKRIVFDNSEFLTKLEALGDYPEGGPNDEKVLNYQHRQGEIMQEWRKAKMKAAKHWYKEHI